MVIGIGSKTRLLWRLGVDGSSKLEAGFARVRIQSCEVQVGGCRHKDKYTLINTGTWWREQLHGEKNENYVYVLNECNVSDDVGDVLATQNMNCQ